MQASAWAEPESANREPRQDGDRNNVVEKHRYDQCASVVARQPARHASAAAPPARRDRHRRGERPAEQQPRDHRARPATDAGPGFDGAGEHRFISRTRPFHFPTGRKERRDDKAESPVGRAAWTSSINLRAQGKLHRHLAELHQLADRKIDRDGPLTVVPVIGRFRVQTESRFRLGRVGNEWLEESGADVVAATIAGVGPDMIEEQPVGPAAGLFQHETGRTSAPLFRAEKRIGSARPEEDGPETEDQPSDRFLR